MTCGTPQQRALLRSCSLSLSLEGDSLRHDQRYESNLLFRHNRVERECCSQHNGVHSFSDWLTNSMRRLRSSAALGYFCRRGGVAVFNQHLVALSRNSTNVSSSTDSISTGHGAGRPSHEWCRDRHCSYVASFVFLVAVAIIAYTIVAVNHKVKPLLAGGIVS
jgi:hypothetical protein